MTRDEFTDQMDRMVGLRFAPSTMDTHWEGLKDVPLDVLTAGVTRAILTRAEFPRPSELREDCDTARGRQETPARSYAEETALPEPVEVGRLPNDAPIFASREVKCYCDRCDDTGWESLWCGTAGPPHPWYRFGTCGRYREHGSHEWVRKCGCWDSNPALLRKRAAVRQYAVAADTARQRGRG